MINIASIRAAARATPGDIVGLTKAQLEALLTEIETRCAPCGLKAREAGAGAQR